MKSPRKSTKLKSMNLNTVVTTIFKCDKKVTLRKPKTLQSAGGKDENTGKDGGGGGKTIAFKCRYKEQKELRQIKDFVKYVTVEVEEINTIKNDICFFMQHYMQRYHPKACRPDANVPIEKGLMFYTWVTVPYPMQNKGTEPRTKEDSVIPFDLYFAKYPLTQSEVKNIKSFLKQQTDVNIECRKLNQIVKCPYDVKVQC